MERNNIRASDTYALSQNKKLDGSMAIQLFQKSLTRGKPPANVIGF
jgi:hypothetical protein